MSYIDDVLAEVIRRNPNEPEYIQATNDVLNSLRPVIEAEPKTYQNHYLITFQIN